MDSEKTADEENLCYLNNKIKSTNTILDSSIDAYKHVDDQIKLILSSNSTDIDSLIASRPNEYTSLEMDDKFSNKKDILEYISRNNVKPESIYTKSEMDSKYQTGTDYYTKQDLHNKDEMDLFSPSNFYTKSEVSQNVETASQTEIIIYKNIGSTESDVGSASLKFKDLHISSNKINIGNLECTVPENNTLDVKKIGFLDQNGNDNTLNLSVGLDTNNQKTFFVKDFSLPELYNQAVTQSVEISSLKNIILLMLQTSIVVGYPFNNSLNYFGRNHLD